MNDTKGLDKYYFAYGSNMSLEQMQERCGKDNFKTVGAAIIKDYQLAFRRRSGNKWCNKGVADLKGKDGFKTYGVLYKINKYALEELDYNEGYQEGREKSMNSYNREERKVILLESGKSSNAMCYFANPQNDFIQPSKKYLDTLIRGAEENGLPEEAIENIKIIGKYQNVI